jgi:hypothetical protein
LQDRAAVSRDFRKLETEAPYLRYNLAAGTNLVEEGITALVTLLGRHR